MMKLMDGRLQELILLVPRACHLNRCKDSRLGLMAFYDRKIQLDSEKDGKAGSRKQKAKSQKSVVVRVSVEA